MLSWIQRGKLYAAIPDTFLSPYTNVDEQIPKWLTDNSEGAWVRKEQLWRDGMATWIDVQYLSEGSRILGDETVLSHIWNPDIREYDVKIGEIDEATVSVIFCAADTSEISGKELAYRYVYELVLEARKNRLGLSKIDDTVWFDRIISIKHLDEYFEPTLDADVHRVMIDMAFWYEFYWMEVGPVIKHFELNFSIPHFDGTPDIHGHSMAEGMIAAELTLL